MTDYYGIGDEVLRKSITETLVEKYRSKLDKIEQGFNAHQEQAGLADTYDISEHSKDDCDKDSSSGVWDLTKKYFSLKLSNLSHGIYGAERPKDITEREKIERLLMQKKTATSYKVWYEACVELDQLQKLNSWKGKKESTLYNYELIENNLKELRETRNAKDIRKLLYLIRTTWTRNIGGIGNVNLFRHSHTGTKTLIEEYLEECQLALDDVTNCRDFDDRYILGMLLQTRKNIGRTALVLSGGGCFGLFHIGVLAGLLEENVLPRIISGSSAGSIVASILSVHTNDEISELLETIVEKKFDIFVTDEDKEGFFTGLSRFFKYGTWYDSKNLQQTMIEFLGDLTFREAYNRTGRILNITVSPVGVHEQPRLLNHLTAPSVLIWSAVCASCSLPGIFQSSTIYEKNVKTGETQEWHHTSVKFVDGSVDSDVPITRLSEMFNVDHIIACQVNPHVVPMLKLSVTCVGGEIETEYSAKLKTKLNQVYDFWASEASHYLQMAVELGVARNICTKLISIINQQYSGDITILPDLSEVVRLDKMLSNPTPEYLLHCTVKGARSTWPKIGIIKNHCGVEFALDNAIKLLRSRNFENLRSNNLPLINSPNLSSDVDVSSSSTITPARVESSINLPKRKHTSLNDFQKVIIDERVGQTTSASSKYHNRHRSESLNIGKLAQLRSQISSAGVTGSPSKSLVRSSSQQMNMPGSPVFQLNRNKSFKSISTRYHRSKSASSPNEPSLVIDSNGSVEFSIPSSESQSPVSFNANGETDSYFRRSSVSGMTNRSPTKKKSTRDFGLKRDSINSSLQRKRGSVTYDSQQSGSIFKKKSFTNVDNLDGLFGDDSRTKIDTSVSNDDDLDDIDPVKVDDRD